MYFRKLVTFILLFAFSLSIISPALGVDTTSEALIGASQETAANPLDLLGDPLSVGSGTSLNDITNPVHYIKPTATTLNLNDYKTEAELRQAVIGDEKWLEQFPNGLFNFLGTQWQINETNQYLEIPVVRQGGTQGPATVDFKAIDVSAEYGKDYVIRVYENSQRAEIAKNAAAVPLISTIGDNASINISDIAKQKTAAAEPTPESSPTDSTEAVMNTSADSLTVQSLNQDSAVSDLVSQDTVNNDAATQDTIKPETSLPTDVPYTELTASMITTEASIKKTGSLREARENYLGQKSDRPDWKTADQGQVEELKVAYDQYINQVAGVQTTLTFADGEYIKYLYLVPLDDEISESEEQVMIALENPTGGASRGEFYMGYANLADNETPEPCRFEITTPCVTAQDGLAAIMVRRTGGLQQNAVITIGTEEGTALSGQDYEPGLEELFFTPGMAEQRITVNILDNPARDSERQFTIALDRTSGQVDPTTAAAVVTIPASATERLLVTESLDGDNPSRLAAEDSTVTAEKITPYGYSPLTEYWRITGDDFLNNGTFKNSNFKPQSLKEPKPRMRTTYYYTYYDYTGDSKADNLYQVMAYDLGNLAGIESINFTYSNQPKDGDPAKDPYSASFHLSYDKTGGGWVEGLIRSATSKSWSGWTDPVAVSQTVVSSLSLNQSKIGFTFSNAEGVRSTPTIKNLDLKMKNYKIRVQQPQQYYKNFFTIKDGALVKANAITYPPLAYTPGDFHIASVSSYVNQHSALIYKGAYHADVYRSDLIEFGFTPNAEQNKDQWCVYYDGFEIKCGNSWLRYPGNQLALNADFFEINNMLSTLDSGYIDIRPVMHNKQANLKIKIDTSNGRLDGIALKQDTFEKHGPDGMPWFFIGDSIVDVYAEPGFKSRTPVWTSKAGTDETAMLSNDDSIAIQAGKANTVANYLLTQRYNLLNINFKSQFIIQANPVTYMDTMTMPTYKLDGQEFLQGGKFSRELFNAAVDQAYDDANYPEVNKNPALEMSFQYKYDSSFTAQQHAFGQLYGAILTVYYGDTVLPKATYMTYDTNQKTRNYTFTQNGNLFTFTGNPRALGWELSDYATVQLKGNNGMTSSQPVTIDFLSNSRDGIIVQLSENGQTVFSTGDTLTPIIMNDAIPNGNYLMQGITSPAFNTVWRDMSADTNRDNFISEAEKTALAQRLYDMSFYLKNRNLENYKQLYDDHEYWNYYRYTPQFYDPSVVSYAMKDVTQESSSLGTISVNLTKRYDTVRNPNVFVEDPLRNAEVYFGSKKVEDSTGNGHYADTSTAYGSGRYYVGQVVYQGNTYNFDIEGNSEKPRAIQLTSAMRPTEFKIDKNDLKNTPFVTIVDKNIRFSYKIDPGTSGASPIDSCVRIYDKNDLVVYEAYSGLCTADVFQVDINPVLEHIKADYYMTVAGIAEYKDIHGQPYNHQFPEVRVGFFFQNPPTPIYMMASYEALKPVVKLLGQLNNKYDLGLTVDFNKDTDPNNKGWPTLEREEVIKVKQPDGTYKEVTRKRGFHTVTYGFSKTFKEDKVEKTIVKNFDNASEDDTSGGTSGDADDDPFASINAMVADDTDGKDKTAVNNTAKANTSGGQPVTVNSGGGDYLKFDIALALTWEKQYSNTNLTYGSYPYFYSLVIMATATPKTYTKEKTWITPVGIPVTIGLDISGSAVLMTSFEKEAKDAKGYPDAVDASLQGNPYANKYNLDPTDGVGFRPENYKIYTKFMIYPTIVLRATAGTDEVSVTVKGRARFDFTFTAPILNTSGCSGNGGVTLDASVKAKFLFVEKNWTLYDGQRIELFSTGSSPQEVVLSALSNPYRNYQYEKLEAVGDENIISRDYLSDKSTWNSHPSGLPQDVHLGYEVELEKGAYPYPQTKLIPIDEYSNLMLFIDDDTTRDARNRSCLMYSIIDGTNSTPPTPIDNDGTWDESPNAFRIGDRILITWADADRVFTSANTQQELLRAMNISGIWFDPATGTLGSKFAITKTVPGDSCGDLNPVISYNPDTRRLMVYYNKIDYADRWTASQNISAGALEDTPDPLYGDIINGYNVITYRYADYDPGQADFMWNETYAPEEGLDAAQYYGQRFLDLAPLASVREEEQAITEQITLDGEEDVTVVTTSHPGTVQTIEPYQGLQDPRIVAMDLTTFNGMAALAYVMDTDADITTVNDQQLYLQTYDYAANTFSSPIPISNNNVQNAQPNFIQHNGATYLYWLENGDIVYTSISDLLNTSGRLKQVTAPDSGKSFYIINKTNTAKEAHISKAVAQSSPIDEFNVAAKEDSVYLLWAEDGSTYKNGLNPGDPGSDDPANINKERQIYVACKVDNGSTEFAWTKPIQVTTEAGANYGDLSFIVMAPEYFLVTYSKYAQYYDSVSGFFSDDRSTRNLGFRMFSITNDLKLGDITTDTETLQPSQLVRASAALFNTGLKAVKNPAYQFFVNADGSTFYQSPWYQNTAAEPFYIEGASDTTISDSFYMPESLDTISEMKLGFRVRNEAGQELVSNEKAVTIQPDLDIQIPDTHLTGPNKAYIKLAVNNRGNKAFNDTYSISAGTQMLYSATVQIAAGEQKDIELEIELGGAQFGPLATTEDGGQYDQLTLDVKFGDFQGSTALIRLAPAAACQELKSVTGFSLKNNGTLLGDGALVTSNYNKVLALETVIEKGATISPLSAEDQSRLNQLEVVWTSSNPRAVYPLPTGELATLSSGTAIITATLQPIGKESISYADGSVETFDKSYKLPDSVSKKISFTVNVAGAANDSSYTTAPTTPSAVTDKPVEPVPVVQPPVEPTLVNGSVQATEYLAGGQLTLSVDDKTFAQTAAQTSGMLIVNSASGSGQLRQVSALFSGGNLQSITQSQMKGLVIDSAAGSITLDRQALDTLASAAPGKGAAIELAVNDANIDVVLKADQTQVNQLNGGSILVSLPRPAQVGEDANSVVVYDLSDPAAPKLITSSVYNTNGKLVFKTDQPGHYTIAYNKVEFRDDLGWARDYIAFLAARDVISGIAPGIFARDKTLTRAEFVTMLARLGGDTPADTATNFADVPSNAWYSRYVKWANKNGIVNGTSAATFSPDQAISREQMAVMLGSYMSYAGMILPAGSNAGFADKSTISTWSLAAINALKAAGIMNGTGNNRFEPKKSSSRAEAAKVLSDVLKMSVK